MKNLTSIPTQTSPRPAPSPFPGGPEVEDTAQLWAMLPVMLTQIMAMFLPDQAARGTLSRIWEMRKILQKIYRAETRNYRLWMTRALRANPVWQAQVRSDLGGDEALARWERRQEQAQTPKPKVKPRKPAAQDARTRPRKLRRLIADRGGLFRLAPVSRAKTETSRPAQIHTYVPRQVGSNLKPIGPVPLTPDDLRPQSATNTAAQGQNSPAPNRMQLSQTWRRLHARLFEWNVQIMLADIAIDVPACRADLAPP